MDGFFNGSHKSNSPGYFEWWYFHFLTESGIAANVVLHETDIFGLTHTPYTSISVQLQDGQTHYDKLILHDGFMARGTQFLNTVDQSFVETQDKITISVRYARGIKFEAVITKYSQPLILNDSVLLESGDKQSFWVMAVPHGSFEGNVIVNETKYPLKGSVYHDHQWGQLPLQESVKAWVWGHYGNQTETYTFFVIRTQAGKVVKRFTIVSPHGVHGYTTAGNLAYLDKISALSAPQDYVDVPTVDFPNGYRLSLEVAPQRLMRSRLNESHQGFVASYLRWSSVAHCQPDSGSLMGITEYLHIRKV